jgi:hypothetical protein
MYVYMQPGLLGQAHAGIYAGLLVDASRMYRARENHRAGRSIALRSTGHCMLCNTRHAKGKHAQRIIPLRRASHHCIRRWTVETA